MAAVLHQNTGSAFNKKHEYLFLKYTTLNTLKHQLLKLIQATTTAQTEEVYNK
jgi:hypothetical protein